MRGYALLIEAMIGVIYIKMKRKIKILDFGKIKISKFVIFSQNVDFLDRIPDWPPALLIVFSFRIESGHVVFSS